MADASARSFATVALLLIPGVLTVYLAFNSGGYFPGSASFAAVVVALALVLRAVAADRPLAGLSRPLAVALGALMLLGIWQLWSAQWSDSSSRALLEFNRTTLYLLVMVVIGSVPRTPRRVRLVLWGLAAAAVGVCVAGFVTRTLPATFPIQEAVQNERLSYPIGYWNALGLVAALGSILCLHLTSSIREPLVARVMGAAALPVLTSTLLFTFSRGPLAVAIVGAVAYLLVARPRGAVAGLLAAGPPTAIALIVSYRADLLASKDPTSVAAAAQGHDVAVVVLICVVAAGLLRRLLFALDVRVANFRGRPGLARAAWLAAGTAVVVAVVVAFVAGDAGDRLSEQYHRFTTSDVRQTGDYRDRLTDPGINRLDQWRVARNAFDANPLRGTGAGTYELEWDRRRPIFSDRREAHSLYLESLGELGVVGAVLFAGVLLALLVGVALRTRGPERELNAAVLVALGMWAVHAGVDWDWEVPAVTLGVLALAAAAVSAPESETLGGRARPRGRVLLGLGCVALAATPFAVAVSQQRLEESLEAYARADCPRAIDRALASLDVLDNRPEPYEVIGYCDLSIGQPEAGAAAMAAAAERDPRNWEYRYGLAILRAAAGRDPRPAVRQALKLNPREPRVSQAAKLFATDNPRQWRRAASGAQGALR